MKTAKLFRNGQSQAVRLPREFRFEGTEVFIKHTDSGVLLMPKNKGWEPFINSLSKFSPDFMNDRNQPEQQKREQLFF